MLIILYISYSHDQTTNFVQQEDLNDQVRIEIEDADDKILHLTDSQEKVKGQILTLQSQINDLTAASASDKNQNGNFVSY